jgi:hypothetical protein
LCVTSRVHSTGEHTAKAISSSLPTISQLNAKELALAYEFASLSESDIPAHHLTGKIHREHRARLVERGVLIRTGRGRYKLYHPLFREFLRQTK